jgi:N,N'-diacetyllegionaminate synthase
MKPEEILIGNRVVGTGCKVFVIAEIGINHGGSVHEAIKLVDEAAGCGADAVKFQTFHADRLMIANRDRFAQQEGSSESAYQMFRRLELTWEDHEKLKGHADSRGILFISTPFDEESVDFLDDLGVPAFKVASSDITHVPLLRRIAAKVKPVLISTGMSYLKEVSEAIWALKSGGAREVLLLHCVSTYPAPPESLNLRSIQTLREQFGLPVGFSDHTQGILFSLAAAVLGAVLIEKHFTLDRNAQGPDHKVSMDPSELRALIQDLRKVEVSLGDGRKRPCRIEGENRRLSRRSIVTAVDIRAYETLAPWMISFKRPGTGIEPGQSEKVVGMRVRRNMLKDTILQWEDLVAPATEGSVSEGAAVARDAELNQLTPARSAGKNDA